MTRIFIIVMILMASISLPAQRVAYQGGYFEKKGDVWYEYKDGKTGVHNHFNVYGEDDNFWTGWNGRCYIAIPKNPSKNNFLLRFPNGDWQFKYTAIAQYSSPSAADSRGASSGRKLCPGCNGSGQQPCTGNHSRPICTNCGGSGRIVQPYYGTIVTCGMCWGKGYSECRLCNGTGKLRCLACGGSGYMPTQEEINRQRELMEINSGNGAGNSQGSRSTNSSGRNRTCPVCNGTGISNMSDGVTSDGIGASNIKYDHKRHVGSPCPYCGSIKNHCHFKCGGCRGTGKD